MHRNIDEIEITIFDTETTGLDPAGGDRIVEIAALKIKGQDELARFQSLVNPQRPVSEAAFKVNGISASMLEGAPVAQEVLPEFLEFIKGSCLCSYNAPFDLGFLNNELALLGKDKLKDVAVLDILKMARRLLPGLERYALWFVAEKLGIKSRQEHRAFSDVQLTLDVFNRFKEMLKAKGIFTLKDAVSLFGIDQRFSADINNQKTAQIQQAIDLRMRLKMRYFSSSGSQVTEREVIPGQIKQEYGQSYLVAYCCLKNEERTFKIDNILHLEMIT